MAESAAAGQTTSVREEGKGQERWVEGWNESKTNTNLPSPDSTQPSPLQEPPTDICHIVTASAKLQHRLCIRCLMLIQLLYISMYVQYVATYCTTLLTCDPLAEPSACSIMILMWFTICLEVSCMLITCGHREMMEQQGRSHRGKLSLSSAPSKRPPRHGYVC